MKHFSKRINYLSGKIRDDIRDKVRLSDIYDQHNGYMYKKYKPMCPLTFEFGPIAAGYSQTDTFFKVNDKHIICYTMHLKEGKRQIKKANYKVVDIDTNAYGFMVDRCMKDVMSTIFKNGNIGIDTSALDITNSIEEIIDSHDLSSLYDLCGYNLNNKLQLIPNINPPNREAIARNNFKLEAENTYYLDVYLTDLQHHSICDEHKIPYLFYCPNIESVKHKFGTIKSSTVLSTIKYIVNYYHNRTFSVMDIYNKIGKNTNTQFAINYLNSREFIKSIPCKIHDNKDTKIVHQGESFTVDENNGVNTWT